MTEHRDKSSVEEALVELADYIVSASEEGESAQKINATIKKTLKTIQEMKINIVAAEVSELRKSVVDGMKNIDDKLDVFDNRLILLEADKLSRDKEIERKEKRWFAKLEYRQEITVAFMSLLSGAIGAIIGALMS